MKGFFVQTAPAAHKRQSGVTLIVVLVILVVMTFLGLGAMSDSNIQLSMVRNSQMQNSAYTAALTEINAQIDAINANPGGAEDSIVLAMVRTAPGTDRSRKLAGGTDFDLLLDDVLGVADYSAYNTSVSLVEPNVDFDPRLAGYPAESDATIKFYLMQFVSTAAVKNTGAESSQIQAFSYLGAR